MAAVSDKTMKRLLWIEDKWTDFLIAMEKPFILVTACAWLALLAVFGLIKGALFVLNVGEHPAFMATGAILFGVPLLLIVGAILFGVVLLVASTPLVVAGRAMWLTKNPKLSRTYLEDWGLSFAKTAIVMFSIVGAVAGVYGITHNQIGVEGFLTYTAIGFAAGAVVGAWGMFVVGTYESADSLEEAMEA